MTGPEQVYLDLYESAKDALPAKWLAPLRERSMSQLRAQGLPNKRVEDWKYTDLRLMLERAPKFSFLANGQVETVTPDLTTIGFSDIEAYRIFFIDGRLAKSDVLPEGVELIGLSDLVGDIPDWIENGLGTVNPVEAQPVVALNTGLMQDGALIRIKAGVVVDKPLHLVSGSMSADPVAFHVHNMVVLEAGAAAVILESYGGHSDSSGLDSTVNEFDIGLGAKLTRIKLLEQSDHHIHLGTDLVCVGEGSEFHSSTFTLQGQVTRNETHVRLDGTDAVAHVGGAFLVDGEQHCDNTVVVEHGAPGCTSTQVFKGVLAGQARGVYQGKTVVDPGSQRTNARQLTRALLLSADAEMDAKPQLEIYADDVQCSHGATTGDIDREALFYLRSRGVAEVDARAMLIRAFLEEIVMGIDHEKIRNAIWARFDRWLAHH